MKHPDSSTFMVIYLQSVFRLNLITLSIRQAAFLQCMICTSVTMVLAVISHCQYGAIYR